MFIPSISKSDTYTLSHLTHDPSAVPPLSLPRSSMRIFRVGGVQKKWQPFMVLAFGDLKDKAGHLSLNRPFQSWQW